MAHPSGGGSPLPPPPPSFAAAAVAELPSALLSHTGTELRPAPVVDRAPVWKGFVIGALAAIAAGVVTHPVDLVKVRLQLAGSAGEAAAPKGPLATAAHIVRLDGVTGLYRGLSGSVLRQATLVGTRLGVYDGLKNALSPIAADGTRKALSLQASIACGLAAGGISAAMCNPADLVLVRMQADGRLPPERRRGYTHALDALRRISGEEGVTALWRGTGPTMARAMVVTSAQMTSYDAAKRALIDSLHLPDFAATHAVASCAAAAAASVASNPFDVVKTRLQNMAPRVTDGKMPYVGVADCFATTVRTEGPLALYKGLTATWARQAPLNAVRFVALEQLRKIFG